VRHDELHDAKLHDLAKRLGAGAAERLDVERTAQMVLARLRAERRVSVVARLWMQPAWLKIAALLVLLLGSGVVARRPGRARAPGTATVIPVGEDLTGLSADQLREAIHSLDQPLAEEGAGSLDAGLEGLSADELRALLHALES